MGSGSSKFKGSRRSHHRHDTDGDNEDIYDDYEDGLSSNYSPPLSPASISRSYYETRGGKRPSRSESRLSDVTDYGEGKLKEQRKIWSEETTKRIHVVVRVRPLNVKEIKAGANDVVYMDELNNECTVLAPKPTKMIAQGGGSRNKSITFSFDRTYNANMTTQQIYNEIPYALVQGVLEGYNATIMAYGQTGSGKSFTMQEDPDHIGIIPRAIVHIFEGKEADEDKYTKYLVKVSYVEIYNEEIRDLLSSTPNRKLEIKGNQGEVSGLTMHEVESVRHCADLLRQGIANRVTSATTMNVHSSRSHAIFTVWLKITHTNNSGRIHVKSAKLNLVDLAGSERHGKTELSQFKYCHIISKDGLRIRIKAEDLDNVFTSSLARSASRSCDFFQLIQPWTSM